MKYTVKRAFGGFAVVDTATGEAVEAFAGNGAKGKAHAHAADLNGQPFESATAASEQLGRGNRTRGGVARGQ